MPYSSSEDEDVVLKVWPKRLYFVMRCHGLTLLMILTGCFQVHFVVSRQSRIVFFKKATLLAQTWCLLVYTAAVFWIFLFLSYFRSAWLTYDWWIKMFITFLLAWLSVPMLWLPLISSQIIEWITALGVTMILMAIHTFLAMFREKFYTFTYNYLTKWTVRAFISSSFGVILSIAWKSSQVDVVVAVIVITSQTIFIVIFGRTVGSDEFFDKEVEHNQYFFIILTHYNFMTWYTHLVLAMCKIRCVLAPFKERVAYNITTNETDENWVEHFGEIENVEYTY